MIDFLVIFSYSQVVRATLTLNKSQTIVLYLFLLISSAILSYILVELRDKSHVKTAGVSAKPSQHLQTRIKSSVSSVPNIVTQTIIVATVAPSPTLIPTKKPVISDIRFGVAVDDYSNTTGELSQLESLLKKPIKVISIFKQFGHPSNHDLVEADLQYIKSTGKSLLIAWEPWNPTEGMQQSRNYLVDIASGAFDSYIEKFAQDVKTFSNPVTIRFGHEMNGNWYPWGNKPEEYKNAYRHIVQIFRLANIPNVHWMWSVNAENIPASPISEIGKYYPGNDMVDWIGIDGFNFGNKGEASSWRSFSDIFLTSYKYIASTYAKPISLSELASAEEGGSKAEWIKNMLNSALQNQFPLVQELIWFNINKEADWRINSSPSSLQAFQSGF